ncbi:transcriptional regulator, AraC family [Chitinophaga jiangningensis]|uniref:Transcriptional regulator, AraC family n=1 Tax=Chitinophaga jiangningensis TaxID=1419482 RepID=A0A1M7JSP0_9BACT|nr:AraC family transcriptional regulator [Chitinophaga jiangningensis]SHM55915.1 transcriptional regulator, AraC family [Chitinophaga jiangningensis]
MEQPNFSSNSLYDLYQHLNLPLQFIDPTTGFSIFNLRDVGFELPYQSASYRPNFFSFLFVKDGQGKYKIDEHTFDVQPHSVYFTNPSNYRTFGWERIEDIFLITFDETFLKKYISPQIFEEFPFLLTETVRPRVVTDSFYEEVAAVYLLINDHYRRESAVKYKVIGHLLAVLLLKIKAYFWEDYNPIYEGNRSSQIVIAFKKMLEKHYRDLNAGTVETVYRVQDYASAQQLHPNYLSNVIKIKTGKPIATWIAEKSTAEAKSMLLNGHLSIKEIAYKLGFMEPAHFSTFFKKHTGSTPVQYRKEHHL